MKMCHHCGNKSISRGTCKHKRKWCMSCGQHQDYSYVEDCGV